MSRQDNEVKSGAPSMYKDDRGGAVLIPHPVIGIVKDNIDPSRNGRIKVYLTDYGGGDPNNEKSWVFVSYMSPWFGSTQPTAGPSEEGKYLTNPQSYGFWASAPDIGTEVVCIFINGKPNQGYYVGCLPKPGAHYMVPAVGAASNVIPNEGEATTYGGADRLPVTEINTNNPKYADSTTQSKEPKPVHSYQAGILSTQGLIRDNIRGVIGSTSMRESPSAVFGFSTPGAPILDGGYTRQQIKGALKGSDPSKFKMVGRTGGHSFVMDDGDPYSGRDQLIRLRSSGGHQITMSDDGQVLFITHSNGKSWVELGPEGTVDIFATNSFNVRTQGDINFHADRDVNIHAKRNFNVNAENINAQSVKNTYLRAGADSVHQTVGTHTHKVGGSMSLGSGGPASFAGSTTYLTGKPINLNTGTSGTQPKDVTAAQLINHIDAQFSSSKGWIPTSDKPTKSIASRVPTHQPWELAGKGVDAETPLSPGEAPAASPTVQAATTQAAATPPPMMTTPELAKTVPSQPASETTSVLPASTKEAITSQNAVAAAAMTATEKAKGGIIPGVAGLKLSQLADSGILKAGVALAAGALMARGVPFKQAVSDNSFTGAMGVTNAAALESNSTVQASIASSSLDNAGLKMIEAGIITGNESPTQIAGLVNAVSQTSAGEVAEQLIAASNNPASSTIPQAGATTTGTTTAVSTGGAQAPNNVATALAAGAFAASMADKLLSGNGSLPKSLSDLKSSLSGGLDKLTSGITGGLDNLKKSFTSGLDSLKSAGQSAVSQIEASYTNLKAGLPNSLGGQPTAPDSPQTKAAKEYDAAKQEKEIAETELFAVKREYYDNKTPENLEKVQAVEARIAAADKKITAASKAFLGLSGTATAGQALSAASSLIGKVAGVSGLNVSGVANGISSIGNSVSQLFSAESLKAQAANIQSGNSTVATTSNSGINALPGGLGAIVAQAKSTGSSIYSFASSVGNSIGNTATSASSLVDGLKGGIPSVSASVSSAKGLFDKLKANGSNAAIPITTEASSLASGTTGEAPPVAATDTQPTAQLTAKLGALLGDSRIPVPNLKPQQPSPDTTPSEADAAVAGKEKALQDIKNAELSLKLVKSTPLGSVPAVIKDAEMRVQKARAAYDALVNSQA